MGNGDVFEEVNEKAAKKVLVKINDLIEAESGRGIIQMFHRHCSAVWGTVKKAGSTPVPIAKKPEARSVAAVAAPITPVGAVSIRKHHAGKTNSLPKLPQAYEPMAPLAKDFVPGPFDVICCRGKQPKYHPGNMFFTKLVEDNCQRYTETEARMEKSLIVSEILDTVRRKSPHGGFVKQNSEGRWCETGDHLAREKITQCFRDRLHTRYSSSSKAKLERRRSSKNLEESISPEVKGSLAKMAEEAESDSSTRSSLTG